MLRSRQPFNDNWRFQRGDPPGVEGRLDDTKTRSWLAPMGAAMLSAPNGVLQRPDPAHGGDLERVQPGYDDSDWEALALPHDWGIRGPFSMDLPGETAKLPWSGSGWYRKRFTLPKTSAEARWSLEVDGAMAYALVWCNGHFVGGWPYGYASWQVDLTQAVKADAENVLVLRLHNPPDSSRWYPGSGLYRNVWLCCKHAIHVAPWGVAVTTPEVGADRALLRVETLIEDTTGDPAAMRVENSLYQPNQKLRPVSVEHVLWPMGKDGLAHKQADTPVAVSEPIAVGVQDGYSAHGLAHLDVVQPRLWSLEDPAQYVLETRIKVKDTLVDAVETPLGIREATFTADDGFHLNGERVQLNGVCMHHDLGALGSALHLPALKRQLKTLQSMGCNAIRTSHNPPAPELLTLCDAMGFLVLDEAFDCWAAPKKPNDYSRLFEDWHERDLRALVRRDRNHPSVIAWSIGNEVAELWFPEGWKVARRLSAIAREEDPSRPTTAGFNWGGAGFDGMQTGIDVMGFNYKPELYNDFLRHNRSQAVYGSETSSCVSSRGFYVFPVDEDRLQGRKDFQVSSYDIYTPEWAFLPDQEFRGLDTAPASAGEFVWTGFDYLGEPTPFNADLTNLLNYDDPEVRARIEAELRAQQDQAIPSRSSYFGIIDLAGFPKDRYFLYQARWRPNLPMAHILPHWDWPERVGEVTPVHVYSSGDEAELFLNGTSLGVRNRERFQYRFRWDDVVYEPGVLEVKVTKAGAPWANAVQKSPGTAERLHLALDPSSEVAPGGMAFVQVSVVDAHGLRLLRSDAEVHCEVEGQGSILAIDNGDPTSHVPFHEPARKLFHGLALVFVQLNAGGEGSVLLKASADGLEAATLSLTLDVPGQGATPPMHTPAAPTS